MSHLQTPMTMKSHVWVISGWHWERLGTNQAEMASALYRRAIREGYAGVELWERLDEGFEYGQGLYRVTNQYPSVEWPA
jgi:hypothetical protein